MQLNFTTRHKVLGLLLICLVTNSCALNIKPKDVWRGDSKNAQVVNGEKETIKADQPEFDTLTCFKPKVIKRIILACDKDKTK